MGYGRLSAVLPKRMIAEEVPFTDVRDYIEATKHIARIQTLGIVIHHTGGRGLLGATRERWLHRWKAIARYHQSKWGVGPGYHIGVNPAGEVLLLAGIASSRACVWGLNDTIVCIAALGNYEDEEPSEAVKIGLANAIILCQYLYPEAKLYRHDQMALLGHETVCPGRLWYPGPF